MTSDLSRTAFPFSLERAARLSVNEEDAERARQIIDSHRDEVGPGRVVPFGSEFEPLERVIGYRFRDRGLLEHALTHRSRVHEDASGGVIDNESLEFLGDSILGFVIADMLFRRVPAAQRGTEVEAQGVDRVGDVAGAARGAHRARRLPDPRPRRGEDRRPPEAGAHRRLLRGADRGDLSRRRHRAGARLHRAAVRRAHRGSAPHAARDAAFTEDYKSALQEWLQSHDRGLPVYRLAAEIGPAHRRRFEVEVLVDGQPLARAEGKSKKEAAQARPRRAHDAERRRSERGGRENANESDSSSSFSELSSAVIVLVDLDDAPVLVAFRDRRPAPASARARVRARRRERGSSRSCALRATTSSSVGGAGRQCRRTQRRIIGSAKL